MTVSVPQRIVDAALELVEDRGLSSVTMKDVAAAAGVARQTVYNHFPDLDAIIGAVVDRHAFEAITQSDELIRTTPGSVAKLEQLIRHHVATAEHGKEVELLAAGLAPSVQVQIAGHLESYRVLIERLLSEGTADGSFRGDLDVIAASMIVHRMLDAGAELRKTVGLAGAIGTLTDMIGRIVLADAPSR